MKEKETNFEQFSLSQELLLAIKEMGFTEATEIQAKSIPVMLQGADIIGQAQTGTGKTAAFGIPMLEKIKASEKHIGALVVCPTRELALQICVELKKMAKFKKGIQILPVYGGEPISRQLKELRKGVHIVVGTPGRIMDHMERGTLKLDKVKMVVLDEADEMLNMGFREDIEEILCEVPKERQTALFSATMPKQIIEIAKKYQRKPITIKAVEENLTASTIEQSYFEIGGIKKEKLITNLMDIHELQLVLVFCNTKKKVDDIVNDLKNSGYKVDGLHGDLSQNQRNQVLDRFRSAEINILVATDVAARGLDVSNVDAVFNYELPFDPEYYVHRIGRTGRAGKLGKAFSLVGDRKEIYRLKDIEKLIRLKVEKRKAPSEKELQLSKIMRLKDKLVQMSSETGLNYYDNVLDELCKQGFTVEQVATMLLKMTLSINPVEDEPKHEQRKSSHSKIKMHLTLGRNDKVRPGDIVGALAGECNISGEDIGVIDIFDSFSFVEVAESDVTRVLKGMKNNTIKGKKVIMQIAKN